ncbi:MAG: UvrD-helicase domain-containing protein [Clostridiales bacterium]|nr:UvrD-helicase domain-containing protein [Clostridiales bacterium]
MSVQLTEEQQRAIDARGQTIVSASAGSGKTFVMISRLVKLILTEADVSEVLAVTFTNKAAAQMREKLRNELVGRIAEETDPEIRARLKAQLGALPLADISTIHAFCARLLRTNFFLAGIDPAFRIVSPEDAEAKALSARAMNEAFDNAYSENGEDFKRLLSVYFRKKKDAYLRELVLTTYTHLREEADYELTLARAGKEDFFEEACALLVQDYIRRADDIGARAEELIKAFSGNARAKEMAELILQAAQLLLGKSELFEMTKLPAPVLPATPRKTKAEGEERANLERLAALSAETKTLYGELRSYDEREIEHARCLEANERAAALCALVRAYDEIYSRLKSEAGVLDYGDLEHFTKKVLEIPAAQEALRAKYKYVFVDEYQDVNPMQEAILSLLTGEEVFLVGDAKQAIYAFRGSDSEFFENKEKELPVSLKLTKNFRSARAVLNAVNDVFGALPNINYAPMTGGERYGEHEGQVLFHRILKAEKEERGELKIYSVLEGSGKSDSSAASEKIVSIVEAELGTEWFDADAENASGEKGMIKRVEYGDIAVLVRKKSGDCERVVRMLSERGIPVTTSSKVNVCDYFEARLIIDWLSLLDNAEQDIPLAGAMLSAIGGFTDSELAQIRLWEIQKKSPSYTFREACRNYVRNANDDLAKKLKRFFDELNSLRIAAQVKTAAEVIHLLLAKGLEAQIASKPDDGRLARVRRLTAEAENAGSVHAFLSNLKAADFRIDFSESGGENAVKVLTMHASKGLEYPVVILANLDTAFRGSERDEIIWTKQFLAAPKAYDAKKKHVFETVLRKASLLLEDEEDRKGERNLLYVAMTRARYRLHLLFDEKDGDGSPVYANKLSDFFYLSHFADKFVPEEELPAHLQRETVLYASAKQNAADDAGELLHEIYRMGERYPYSESTKLHVKSSATDLMHGAVQETEEKRPLYFSGEGHEKTSVDAGLAYHAFLQFVEFGADAEEELARMKRENLLTKEQLALLNPERLRQILNIPCLKALAGKRVFREQKFLVGIPACEIEPTAAQDSTVYQGAIDLLYEDGDGFVIVDYKFSSLPDERIKEKYAVQIALYKKAVARVMQVDENTIRARIVNIFFGREIVM